MELKTKLQHRTAYQPTGLIMRENDEEHSTLSGVAIVTNAETTLYEGSDWREIEIIDPSCLNAEFMAEQDIKLNLLHERSLSFARNNKGKGTLVLETREDGLHFEAPGDDSSIARQASDLIKNGTYTGCSFEFWAKDYEVTERTAQDGKKEYVIRHKAFERIGAITIGMDPAYEQTSVNAREIYREQHAEELNRDEAALLEKKREEEEAKRILENREREARRRWRDREGYLLSLNS